jgi:peptidoglycan biosynthesis protein MviN/MurJ (putative lipid II flippase)
LIPFVSRRFDTPGSRALVGTLVGSSTGFLLPFVVAAHFGVGRVTDAYVFALAIAQFCVAFAATVLEANALPAAGAAMRDGRVALLSFVRRTSYQAVAAVVPVLVIVSGIAYSIASTRASWTPKERNEAVFVLVALVAYVICTALSSVHAGAIYALDDFITPTLTLTLRAALPLVGISWCGRSAASAVALASLISAGELLRTVILRWRLLRLCEPLPSGTRVRAPGIWNVLAPHALSLIVVGANPIVDRAIASSLPAGSVTLLDLGEKVFYVPLTVIMSSVGLVVGARWASATLPSELPFELKDAMRRAAMIAVVLAAAIGAAVLAVSYATGPTFAGASTVPLRNVILVLLLGLPGAAVAVIGGRFLTATRQTRALPAFALMSVFTNALLDVVGSKMYGIVGIAAATVIARGLSAVVYMGYCARVARRLAARGDGLEWSSEQLVSSHTAGLSGRVRPRMSLSGAASAAATMALAPALGLSLVAAPTETGLLLGSLAAVAALVLIPIRYLPAGALVAYALVPGAYLNVPSVIGRFFSPSIAILVIWAVRVRLGGGSRPPRRWIIAAVACALWLLWGTLSSIHETRTAAWAIVFFVAVPLAGAAAYRSEQATRDILLRTWVALAVVLGTAGVLEGVAKRNPLSKYYVDAGHPLIQKWSVYRIETTLGHPLDNAMFFATTACLLTMLAIRAPTRWRWLGAATSAVAMALTVSRTGVVAVSAGIAFGLLVAVISSQLSIGRKAVVCAVVACALVGAMNAPILKERGQSSEARTSVQYRVQVVRESLDIARRFGYVGSGAGTSQTAAASTGYKLTVESSPLELLISVGVPGLALLLVFVLAILATAMRHRRFEAVAALVCLIVAASGFNAWDADPASLALLAFVFVVGAGGLGGRSHGMSSARATGSPWAPDLAARATA